MTRPRPFAVVLVLGAASALARDGLAEDKPAAQPGTPTSSRTLTEKEKGDLLPLLRNYLDADSEKAFAHRLELFERLKALRAAGCDVLADTGLLTKMIYDSRPFSPVFEKRNLPKDSGKDNEIRTDAATGITSVVWDSLRLSFFLPPKYPAKDVKALNQGPPWPMVVTLHELDDFQTAREVKKYPGEEVIKRRWKGPLRAVTDSWIVYAPVATKARFADDDRIHSERVDLSAMWTRYHVDFDRIVIDGGSDALLFAASRPIFFAGVIVRGDAADIAPDLAKNMAHVPVYVVGTDASAAKKSLEKGGYPKERLTVGGIDGLPAWLKPLSRTVPRDFEWRIKEPTTQSLAHWVNVEESDRVTDGATLKVEVVDTKEDPNTVRLTTVGARRVMLFLNDRIVDLSRPVRVVANGVEVKNAYMVTGSEKPDRPSPKVTLPRAFDRNPDVTFDTAEGLSIRKSRYYGWLFPAAITGIEIKKDAGPKDSGANGADKPADGAPAPKTPAGPASPQMETEASAYFTKGEEAAASGNREKAILMMKKAIAVGDTSVKEKAEARLKELEATK